MSSRSWLTSSNLIQAKTQIGTSIKVIEDTLDEKREFLRALAYGNTYAAMILLNKHPKWINKAWGQE